MKNFIRILRIYIIRRLALITAKDIKITDRVLIVAPHPDDEIIGCTGLITSCIEKGNKVFLCILTGGEASHQACCNINKEKLKQQRRNLTKKINCQLGVNVQNIFFLDFKDGNINIKDSQVKRLKTIIEETQPESIFIPHQKGEGWSDHIEAGNIIKMLTSNRTLHIYEYCVWFWYYNVWSIDWKNAFLIRMSDNEHKKKLQSIQDYITPLAPCGKPYSGVLPNVFIKGNQWKNELYFRIK